MPEVVWKYTLPKVENEIVIKALPWKVYPGKDEPAVPLKNVPEGVQGIDILRSLQGRAPFAFEIVAVNQCSGNSRGFFSPPRCGPGSGTRQRDATRLQAFAHPWMPGSLRQQRLDMRVPGRQGLLAHDGQREGVVGEAQQQRRDDERVQLDLQRLVVVQHADDSRRALVPRTLHAEARGQHLQGVEVDLHGGRLQRQPGAPAMGI